MPDYKDFLRSFRRFLESKRGQKVRKTVYLHIGTHKTGTTSIQNMLADNRELLRNQGYFYPLLAGPTSHYIAHYFGFGTPRTLSDFNQQKPRNEHEAFINDRMRLQIKENDNIILSSEVFSSVKRKSDISKLTEIKKYFPDHNFIIIAYLRRQDHFIESSYNQKVKTGNKISDIIDYSDRINIHWYDMLSWFSKVFGKQNIVVRPFEKSAFSENGLYHDFLNILGITDHRGFVFPDNELNKKFNEDIMSIIRFCPEADSMKIVALLKKVDKNNTRGYYLLSPAERIEILKKYEISNRKVALEYLGKADGQLFDEPWPDPNEQWEEYKGLTNEKTISIIMELLVDRQNRLNLLNEKFNCIKKHYNR